MPIDVPLRIPLGSSNAYLVPTRDGYILVDAGNPGWEKRFFSVLRQHDVAPGQIQLILLTHVHWDHVGSLHAIKESCGAPIMVHESEATLLTEGRVVFPPGMTFYGKVVSPLLPLASRLTHLEPCPPEHALAEEVYLGEFGIDARVMHTPGHSPGSVTLLTGRGQAFVGDLCFNALPFGLGSCFPPFGEDGEAVMASWRRLIIHGATHIYPGHGLPFSAQRLQRRPVRSQISPSLQST